MQEGSVIREHRKLGPDVWSYRWWESGPNGNRVHRRIVLGTADQLRDLSSARQMTTELMREINATDIRMAGTFITVAQLADHFQQRELGLLERTNLVLHQEGLSGLPRQMDCSSLGRLHPPKHQSRRSRAMAHTFTTGTGYLLQNQECDERPVQPCPSLRSL